MRKSEANSLVHDLLNLEDWQNPLDKQMVEGNVQINLLTKEITGTDDDWIIEFFKKKIDWFQERVKKLDGLKDFQKAEIKLVGNKEKVELIFKNETLSGEVFWGQYLTEMKERFEKY